MHIASVTIVALLGAVSPQAPAPAPTCGELLQGLVASTERNYAGFVLEVLPRPRHRAQYDDMVVQLQSAALQSPADSCFSVLASYVAWFHDPHLFVFQSARLDSAESRRRMATVPRVAVDEISTRQRLASLHGQLDPIEGIWHDGAMRLAVVPDPEGTPDRYLAVVLESDSLTLPVGAVHAVFDRRADGGYDTELRWRSLARTRPDVSLHRGGTLLRLSPGMWGKLFPGPAAELALLDTADVHRPTFAWRDSVAIVSVPSHDGSQRARLDALLRENLERLRTAPLLVVDLRGNEGGGSGTTAGLLPWLLDRDSIDATAGYADAVLLSSPDQVAYAKRAFGPDTSAFVRRLVSALERSPGELVELFDAATLPPRTFYPSPVRGPGRVAMLIDGGTVSAAEVLVKLALESPRAVVMGEPTAGALDYQNVNIVRFHPDESRWLLGYPTIAASARLPEGGIRGTGLEPEIRVHWATVADPIAEAVRLLGGTTTGSPGAP